MWAWVVPGFLDKWGGERGTSVTGERNFFVLMYTGCCNLFLGPAQRKEEKKI